MIRIFLDRLYLSAGYAAGAFLILIFGIMMFMSLGRQVGLIFRQATTSLPGVWLPWHSSVSRILSSGAKSFA